MGEKKEAFMRAGMLSDVDIKLFWGNGIDIFSPESGELAFDLEKQLQYGSIDLHFRHEYKKMKQPSEGVLTYDMLRTHSYTNPYELRSGEKLRVAPGEIILTTTLETIHFSEEFAGIITGRSSIARLGIMVHCCQEYINPGHGQPIPLQLINLAPYPVELDLNVPICQLVVFRLRTPSSGRYKDNDKAKYADEIGPQGSKIYEEVSDEGQSDSGNAGKEWERIRKFCSKYFLPFLPAIIMALVITPFFASSVVDKDFSDVFAAIREMPLAIIIGVLLCIIYIWIKKGEDK